MKEIFFHEGLDRHESIGMIIKGIYAGTLIGTGLTLASAVVAPALSPIVLTASALGSGFVTTYIMKAAAERAKASKRQV